MSTTPQAVEHLVLMGAAGCGKTTAAENLRQALGRPVAEADDFHPQASIDKMTAGTALTDEDRWPWLESLRDWMSSQAASGAKTIVTCSALKRSYRDLLSNAAGRVFFIHLVAPHEELADRVQRRDGHFMPAALLPSQLAALEPLAPEEDGATVVSQPTPEQTLDAILAALAHASQPRLRPGPVQKTPPRPALVPPVGLEPTTFGLKVRSSDQLS